MAKLLELNQYLIREKFLKIFGNKFRIMDSQNNLYGFCEQKRFRIKEDLRIYDDEQKNNEWLVHKPLDTWIKQPILLLGGWWDPHLNGILDIYNKSISKLELTLSKKEQLKALNKLELNGNTSVYFNFEGDNKKLSFKLKKNRKVDRNTLNFLKKEGIITQIR